MGPSRRYVPSQGNPGTSRSRLARGETLAARVDMSHSQAEPPSPGDDGRWAGIDNRMRKLGNRPDAVIEALHAVQETFGSIDEAALKHVSETLSVPPSTVFGVATFYHYFRLRPQGEHTCVVCTGTACYIDGAFEILAAIDDRFDLEPHGTTADGTLSLLTGRCFGSCSLAPAAIVDGAVQGHVTAPELVAALERLSGTTHG
jgi:bidirectional [NiFe] hydrogenase diaphorase subunit